MRKGPSLNRTSGIDGQTTRVFEWSGSLKLLTRLVHIEEAIFNPQERHVVSGLFRCHDKASNSFIMMGVEFLKDNSTRKLSNIHRPTSYCRAIYKPSSRNVNVNRKSSERSLIRHDVR